MVFWQVFVVFSFLSSIFILWPLLSRWKNQKKALREAVRDDLHIAVRDDRVQELEATLALGDISRDELESLHDDLEKTIALEAQSGDPSFAVALGTKTRVSLVGVCLCAPFFVLLVYSFIGAKSDWEITQIATSLQTAEGANTENRKRLVSKIHDRLEETPENGHLWFLLGSTAVGMGDYEEAVNAYRELKEIHPESPLVLAEYAQALFLRGGNTITPDVRIYTKKALELSPNLPIALGLAGIDAFQAGMYTQAILTWQRAVKQLDPSSTASKVLTQGIASAQIALKQTGGEKKQTPQAAAVTKLGSLKVRVALGKEVSGLKGGETVFVYARAWKGPRMPLAIQKFKASELPKDIELTAEMAMAEGMDIHSVSQLEVVARVSLSGGAAPQSGDWTTSYGPIILTESIEVISLTISERHP